MDRPDPRVGTVLAGRYKILERSSAGSMGVVYRAERVQLKRAVAIKFLNEGYAASDDGLRRFEVEARAMSRLEHPNCVPVTDYGVSDGAPYLVMDFVKGITLAQLLANEWRVTPTRAVAIMRQVAAGLAHAHAQRIIHRDVKPANILISAAEGHGDHVRLVDFGLAKLRDEGSFTTGVAVGTPSYMSPEQTIGERADERADIYACGVILYELLTGTKPFQAETPFEVMRMHREAAPLPLVTAAQGVEISARLDAVVMKAMAKSRDERFATMAELQFALADVDEARGARGGQRGRVVLAGAGAALVATGAVVALLLAGGEEPAAAQGAPTAARANDAPARPAPPAPPPAADVPVADQPAPRVVTPDPAPAVDAAAAAAEEDPEPRDPTLAADQIARLRARATEDGDLRSAIAGLEALRKSLPGDASVHLALANTYAEDLSWEKAVQSYAAALRIDESHRTNPRLVADVVEALGSRDAHREATALIEKQVRDAALPRLAEASRSTNRDLRTRARKLRARLR